MPHEGDEGAAHKAASEGPSEAAENSEVGGVRRLSAVTGQTLREHFHLPLHTVAQKFGMCTTAFKKMCRRLGIAKWPHRQLRGIDKKIAALKAELNYATTGDRQQFVSGIMCLEEEKSKLSRGAMHLSGRQAADASDSERPECRSGSTDEKGETEDDEDAQTPPPSVKLQAMDSDEEEVEMPSLSGHAPSRMSDGGAGTAVICERELRQHFHLPLHTAAQKFGICTTAFKKLCRRFGIAKWPHRQLRGIDKKIAALKAELNYTTGDREGCCRSLKALREEKMRISGSSGQANAADRGDEPSSGASSFTSSPILASADRGSCNDSLWHGGRCLTEDTGGSSAEPELPVGEEEREAMTALSMLAQLAGRTQERDRTAVDGLPVETNAKGANAGSSLLDGLHLGKRGAEQVSSLLCAAAPCSSGSAGSSGATSEDLDTPPLEPQASMLLSPLAAPFDSRYDKRACGGIGFLPPIVPAMEAQDSARPQGCWMRW